METSNFPIFPGEKTGIRKERVFRPCSVWKERFDTGYWWNMEKCNHPLLRAVWCSSRFPNSPFLSTAPGQGCLFLSDFDLTEADSHCPVYESPHPRFHHGYKTGTRVVFLILRVSWASKPLLHHQFSMHWHKWRNCHFDPARWNTMWANNWDLKLIYSKEHYQHDRQLLSGHKVGLDREPDWERQIRLFGWEWKNRDRNNWWVADCTFLPILLFHRN